MRGETAGEQQVVGMVWSVFESCGAEEKVCHGARCLLECEQHNSKRIATLISSLNFFFFFYQEVSKHFKRKLTSQIEKTSRLEASVTKFGASQRNP